MGSFLEMAKIETFPFEKDKFHLLEEYHYGTNWPVIYIQENGTEMYIGQTTNVYSRSKQHFEDTNRRRLKTIHVITDEEFNLSTNYDFESLLIQYVAADGKYTLQNSNGGLVNHNYYDRERYQAKLRAMWPLLQEKGLVKKEFEDIKNSEFFKFSPYKALTEDQLDIADRLFLSVKKRQGTTHIVNGAPGTGKSVLALYLLKLLKDNKETQNIKAALVIPMVSLRTTLQRVLRRVPNMGAEMVIGPNDVAKKEYDLLLVDEAHRLKRRVNLTNFGSYDAVNKMLNLPKDASQLDWILARSKQQILFYDKRQNIIPGDVRATDFNKLKAHHYELTSQLRVEGGEDYLQFVDDLLNLEKTVPPTASKYDFKIYDDVGEMIADIKQKNNEHKLARVVAGFAWPWATKDGGDGYDIEIDGHNLRWNSTNVDWVSTPNSINEVGCIHSTQGYDLNFAGVIIGAELSYDPDLDELVINKEKYEDTNGKRALSHPDELKQYIINIYRTLLTRGIKGTYVYVVDSNLRKKLMELIGSGVAFETEPETGRVKSPISIPVVSVPLVGSAPCGNPLLGEENVEEYIDVPKSKIKPGFNYFILRAEGDSMNLAGINDGDLVLCRQQLKADTGDRVVALLGDNVTIKVYGPREEGVRLLQPKSSNKSHLPITPGEGDSVQGVVQEVLG